MKHRLYAVCLFTSATALMGSPSAADRFHFATSAIAGPVIYVPMIHVPAITRDACPFADKLADAIYIAEGGLRARVPYGVLAQPTTDVNAARCTTLITINRNWRRWFDAGQPGAFVDFMADRWCPPSDDPVGNINWKRNVYSRLNAG